MPAGVPRGRALLVLVALVLAAVGAPTAAAEAPSAPAAVPTITGLAPDGGPATGGTEVVITGSGFTGATDVRFTATRSATSFTVESDTRIVATTPNAEEVFNLDPTADFFGVNVFVDTPEGTARSGDERLKFRYLQVQPLALTAMGPRSGPAAGGDRITLSGTGLRDADAVLIGGVRITTIQLWGTNTIRVTTPPAPVPLTPTATVDVQVERDGELTPITPDTTYTYLPAPVLTAMSPQEGTRYGGQPVVIDYTEAVPMAKHVTVDGEVVEHEHIGPGQIRFITPPHDPGPAAVRLNSAGGASNPITYTFLEVAQPVITSVTPDNGPSQGGQEITLRGRGFTGATEVRVGGKFPWNGGPAPWFEVVSDTEIRAVTPSSASDGVVYVVVQTPNGPTDIRPSALYRYNYPSSIRSVTPAHGPVEGGQTLTVTASAHLTGVDQVEIDGTPVPFDVVDDRTLTVVTPPHAEGVVRIRVHHPLRGWSFASDLHDHYRYGDPPRPVITTLSAHRAPSGGGLRLIITGEGFFGTEEVRVGSNQVGYLELTSDRRLYVTVPPGPAGWMVNVWVDSLGGTNEKQPRSLLYYEP